MAFFNQDELKDLYTQSRDEAYQWRRNYEEFERLADNELAEDIDETLPEVTMVSSQLHFINYLNE